MVKLLAFLLAALLTPIVAVAAGVLTAIGIVFAALLSPVIELFNHQPSKFNDYGQ